jgi:hypothetical protein
MPRPIAPPARRGLNRSQLYARALSRYLSEDPGHHITRRINQMVGEGAPGCSVRPTESDSMTVGKLDAAAVGSSRTRSRKTKNLRAGLGPFPAVWVVMARAQ